MLRHGTSTATNETRWSGLRPAGDAGPDLISETWNVDVARCVHLDYGPTSRHRLRGLVTGLREPGEYMVHWDRRDDSGRSVARGVYWIELRAGAESAVRKLVLLGS